MSQIYKPSTSSGPIPPTVATSYVENTGVAIPASNILNVLGTGGITTTGSGNTVTIDGSGVTGDYISISPFIVGKPGDTHAGYTTIQAGINAAIGSGSYANVYVKPGTYTENLILDPNIPVNIIGFGAVENPQSGFSNTGNSVILIGSISQDTSNSQSNIYNIHHQPPSGSNGVILTNGATINFQGCKIDSPPNEPYVSVDSSGGNLFFINCIYSDSNSTGNFCTSASIAGGFSIILYNTSFFADNANSTGAFTFTVQSSFCPFLSIGLTAISNGTFAITDMGSHFTGSAVTTDGTASVQLTFKNTFFDGLNSFSNGGSASGSLTAYNSIFSDTTFDFNLVAAVGPIINCSYDPTKLLSGNYYLINCASFEFGSSTNTIVESPRYNAITFTSTNNYTTTFFDTVLFVDCSGGAKTIKLNANAALPFGFTIIIKDSTGNAFANNITIDGNSQNIDGQPTKLIDINYETITLIYNGSSWNIL